MIESLCVTSSVRLGQQVSHWGENDSALFESRQFAVAVRMPLVGPIATMLQGRNPDGIELDVPRTSAIKPRRYMDVPPVNVLNLTFRLIAPYLVEFYEDWKPWLNSSIGDYKSWPNVWQFARIIRNAVAHNRVKIDDQNFLPIAWYTLAYGPAQNGRLLSNDLSFADILILMFEMNDSLDSLGCAYCLDASCPS
jgi:hypothetical protein